MPNESEGVVYVLSNPAMPGLIKIGKTGKGNAEDRMSNLYTTGVPVPFECEYAARVDNADQVEAALHTAFAQQRVNPKREFFKIEPNQPIAILELLAKQDVTPQMEAESQQIDEPSREAGEAMRKKRQPFDFGEMGIPPGSRLESLKKPDVTAMVVDNKKVKLQDGGPVYSLSEATRMVLGIERNVQPSWYWSFNGRVLKDIYEETYPQAE